MLNNRQLLNKTALLILLTLSMAQASAMPIQKTRSLGQAITQGIQSLVLGTFVACTGLLGCADSGLRSFSQVLQDRGDAEVIPTQKLYVYVDDKDYEGVIGKDGNGRITVQTYVGGGAFIFLQDMEGTAGFSIDRHQFIGQRVYLDSVSGLNAIQRSGIIKEVFDNGYYLIAIDSEHYVKDGGPIAVFLPYDLIAHEFYLEKEDGTSFFDNAYRQ